MSLCELARPVDAPAQAQGRSVSKGGEKMSATNTISKLMDSANCLGDRLKRKVSAHTGRDQVEEATNTRHSEWESFVKEHSDYGWEPWKISYKLNKMFKDTSEAIEWTVKVNHLVANGSNYIAAFTPFKRIKRTLEEREREAQVKWQGKRIGEKVFSSSCSQILQEEKEKERWKGRQVAITIAIVQLAVASKMPSRHPFASFFI